MRRTRQRVPGSHVALTLELKREHLESLDWLSELMGVSRQETILRGLALLNVAGGVVNAPMGVCVAPTPPQYGPAAGFAVGG